MLYGAVTGTNYEQFALDTTTPDAKPIPLVVGHSMSDEGRFSPNGKWVAYHSNERILPHSRAQEASPAADAPKVLFTTGIAPSTSLDQFAVSGNRFLLRLPESASATANLIDVLINWRGGASR